MTTLKHPMNGHTEEVTGWASLWALLFGLFYFMYRGIWRHVMIQLVLIIGLYSLFGAPATMFVFLMWVIYAVMAPGIVRSAYLRDGYSEGSGEVAGSPAYSAEGLSHLHPKVEAPPADDAWAAAMAECDSDARQAGLWARVFAQAGGDEAKAKAAYISERVKTMHPKMPERRSWASDPVPLPPPR